jgi:hypothetical protein
MLTYPDAKLYSGIDSTVPGTVPYLLRQNAVGFIIVLLCVQVEMPWVPTPAKPLVCLQHSGHGMVRFPPPGWSHASPEIYRRLGPTPFYGSVYGRVLHLYLK